jgi:hypothetical protein
MRRLMGIMVATGVMIGAAGAACAQDQPPAMDLMAIADANKDGKVSPEEYTAFSEQGWGFVSEGKDKVKLSELNDMSKLAFFGITPNADGDITKQMYLAAIPARFKMFDANHDGSLSSDELNGRALRPN